MPPSPGEEALSRRLVSSAPRSAVLVLREKSCGVVPYRDEGGRILYLVISSAVTKREHWEFPKGGVEEGEREVQTALRELQEETGVSEVRLLPGFREPIRYIYRRPEGLVSKQVIYFIGKVSNPAVTLREVEAKDYRWATYDETYRLIRHANARILLERVHAFITGKPQPERPVRRQPHPGRPPRAPAPLPLAVTGATTEVPTATAPTPAVAPTSVATPSEPSTLAVSPAPAAQAEERPPRSRRRKRRRRKGRPGETKGEKRETGGAASPRASSHPESAPHRRPTDD